MEIVLVFQVLEGFNNFFFSMYGNFVSFNLCLHKHLSPSYHYYVFFSKHRFKNKKKISVEEMYDSKSFREHF